MAMVALLAGCGGTMQDPGCPSGCAPGYTCEGSTCVPPAGGCAPACQAGFTCQGTTCVPNTTGCTPACQTGFTCQGTTCVVDPTGYWIITVTSGQVAEKEADGSCWDTPCGLPDPFVCLTINGAKTCTPAQMDTLQPVWNYAFPAATATAMESGVVAAYMDQDLTSDDVICSGTVPIKTESFVSGQWGVSCTGTTSGFSATLRSR